jgi:hypothetical protein
MTEREIFLALLDLPDTVARDEYLRQHCADDGLRKRIWMLLNAHATIGDFLSKPVVSAVREPGAATLHGSVSGSAPGHGSAREEALTFLEPSTRPDALGRIGRYEILEILGRGSFGIVMRAFDESLQRAVAVKALAPQFAATSPARKRFLREARSSAKVRHENVVQVYSVEEHPVPFLVMEFIPGETLQQKLERTGPLDAREVIEISEQIAEGLAAAHAEGLIHRDIKPANVLLESGPRQRVKLTDFGLARAADDASISQSGIVAGTPMYMAPEQALGQALDQRADLFSLGSVMYQMAAGRPPFRAPGALAVLKRVADDAPRPMREIIPETPQWLCDLISRLHAKKPADRFQSAREVIAVLKECSAQLRADEAVQRFPVIRVPPRPKPAHRFRRWHLAAIGAAALLGAIAVGALPYLQRDRGSQTVPLPIGGPGLSVSAEEEYARIAAMPAAEQVEAVRRELQKRNPLFDRVLTPVIEDGVVTEVEFASTEVTDIWPVRAFRGLKKLRCVGFERNGKLADLTPLRGLLLGVLDCNNTQVSDLTPLAGMPLAELGVHHTRVRDLSPLAGMPLQHLNCSHTQVADLAPLKGLKLLSLYLDETRVADLSPLRGMPLKRLHVRGLSFPLSRDREVLRSLAELEVINSDPAADFLKQIEADR